MDEQVQQVAEPTLSHDGLPSEPTSVEPTTPQPVDQPTPTEPTVDPRQKGYEQVDFNDIPEAVRGKFQDRFNNLYYQVKQSQREISEREKYYQGLEQKLDNFINATEADKRRESADLLAEKAKKLFNTGDYEAAVEATRSVARLEAELASDSNDAKGTTETKEESPSSPFSQEEQDYLLNFVKENQWAAPQSPLHGQVKESISKLLASGVKLIDAVNITKDIVLTMAPRTTPSKQTPTNNTPPVVQTVLGRSGTVQGGDEKKTPRLNEYEQKIALRFFPKLSKDEAFARYARGKEK